MASSFHATESAPSVRQLIRRFENLSRRTASDKPANTVNNVGDYYAAGRKRSVRGYCPDEKSGGDGPHITAKGRHGGWQIVPHMSTVRLASDDGTFVCPRCKCCYRCPYMNRNEPKTTTGHRLFWNRPTWLNVFFLIFFFTYTGVRLFFIRCIATRNNTWIIFRFLFDCSSLYLL